MTPTYRILERVSMASLTGYQFVDSLTATAIGQSLNVFAFSATEPDVQYPGSPNPSGFYIFKTFPSFQATVLASDPNGGYLPLQFDASATASGSAVPLFVSSASPLANGLATVRARLLDANTGLPGAWALLDLSRGGQTWTGLADESGSVVVLLPYPEPVHFGVSSISGGTPVPLNKQRWTFSVAVRYHRWPDLRSIPRTPRLSDLNLLPLGRLWNEPSATTPFGLATLEYGNELILRSRDTSEHETSVLLLTP